jgi:hypothetical protein
MLGQLKLPLFLGRYHVICGGPFRSRPKDMPAIKLAVEIDASADLKLDIEDYNVPEQQALDEVLRKAVTMILHGEPMYAGCMGGKGRTGLFLAILAKAFGVRDPVAYVRRHYYSHAVETNGQNEFVRDYQIPVDVQKMVRRAKWESLFRFRFNLTLPQQQLV